MIRSIALALLLATVLISCDNETKHCWECTVTYTGKQATATSDSVLCNFTETDIELRQDIKFSLQDSVYDSWMLTNCRKQ